MSEAAYPRTYSSKRRSGCPQRQELQSQKDIESGPLQAERHANLPEEEAEQECTGGSNCRVVLLSISQLSPHLSLPRACPAIQEPQPNCFHRPLDAAHSVSSGTRAGATHESMTLNIWDGYGAKSLLLSPLVSNSQL